MQNDICSLLIPMSRHIGSQLLCKMTYAACNVAIVTNTSKSLWLLIPCDMVLMANHWKLVVGTFQVATMKKNTCLNSCQYIIEDKPTIYMREAWNMLRLLPCLKTILKTIQPTKRWHDSACCKNYPFWLSTCLKQQTTLIATRWFQ
jgi:hypothetical protein